ncbi:fam-b protein [Plasmodium vinckei brucechwatti]|uniref:Fam-b protein n=1 Tax=Plasmodium vinckei brucechwatti TaxID=119398 RepID=A0A6V7S430_PLAVN|nr:fam-b protein [Plasmodium vinckei brucechwatti]
MRVNILNVVFLSIIICSFGLGKNELYFINGRNIYLEKNITNFRNNRILADADNQFDLNNFYESTLSLVNQFSDCNDDDEEITNLRNIIDSHIKKHKENNTLPNLNNLDRKTKKLIHKIQKELNEAKKELDNIGNGELKIQPIYDKRIIKKDENNFVSEQEDFKQLENYENIFEIGNYNFEGEYNEIISSSIYREIKMDENLRKDEVKFYKKMTMILVGFLVTISSGMWYSIVFLIPYMLSLLKKCWKITKLQIKISKIPKSSR